LRTYAEHRRLRFPPEQMFALVADVERYPDFLPWCLSTRILGRDAPDLLRVGMTVGFGPARDSYTSLVKLSSPSEIGVESLDGPFRELHTRWRFDPASHGGTEVGFEIAFAFRSRLLQAMIGTVFDEAARRMVRSFEKRAETLYGKGTPR
jgi:coenzyme Q-binding protein COQ10